jgi:hypothetical protein
LQNAIVKIKRANLQAYEPYQGSSDEEDMYEKPLPSTRTEDLDAMAQYDK